MTNNRTDATGADEPLTTTLAVRRYLEYWSSHERAQGSRLEAAEDLVGAHDAYTQAASFMQVLARMMRADGDRESVTAQYREMERAATRMGERLQTQLTRYADATANLSTAIRTITQTAAQLGGGALADTERRLTLDAVPMPDAVFLSQGVTVGIDDRRTPKAVYVFYDDLRCRKRLDIDVPSGTDPVDLAARVEQTIALRAPGIKIMESSSLAFRDGNG